ncbi:MAG: hypothetical protein ACLU4J_04535 [Butyricimonas paravirosa]
MGHTEEVGQPLWWTSDGREVDDIQNASPSSLVYSGQSDPKVNVALDNTLRYKGFSLNFMLVYYGGHKMRVRQYYQMFDLPSVRLLIFIPTVGPRKTRTRMYRESDNMGQALYSSVIEKYGYLRATRRTLSRFETLRSGDVPENSFGKIGLNNLQLRFQVNNLPALWKKNNVKVDPETLGIRRQVTYVLGLNFNF